MKTHRVIKKVLPFLVWEMPVSGKEIYLTFDDGPIPVVTEFVLDSLKLYNAKATFFMVGHNIEKHPDIFRKVVGMGHSVGNHTHNHLNGWKTDVTQYLQNTEQCALQLQIAMPGFNTVKRSKPLFRPPYGKLGLRQLLALRKQYRVVMWDVLTGDFDQQLAPEKCLQKAIQHTEAGSIVIFHDSLKAEPNLRYALPRFLEHYHNQGYQFKAL